MKKGLIFFTILAVLLSSLAFSAGPFIDWANLKNPVYQYKNWSIKDSCVAYHNETFYIFFSAFYFDDGRDRCHISAVKTKDFKNYSEPLFIWRGESGAWDGMCSPNIIKIDDTFYLTYNSWGDDKNQPNQLFYAKSKNLERWENDKPLAANVTKGKRSIDAAIAKANGKYYLVWKEDQTPMMGVGDTLGPEGWKRLGTVPGGWFENGEFIQIDEKWYLLATDKAHLPVLRAIRNDGRTDEDWLNLCRGAASCAQNQAGQSRVFRGTLQKSGQFQRLNIPLEKFNTVERANCAFLIDWRDYDGFFYLLYSGRNQGFFHEGDNYFKLGIARSQDLLSWQVPPK